ncbi:DUF882 domain-containing protein [Aureimonas populi]|uniref:DUF882 domain-containing protein n=1 Tax=Aureimonas populi TaxID=1701758 RepID=UPI001AE95DE5|nr:DUF882 domain-containing protein [Aureimonas populi]
MTGRAVRRWAHAAAIAAASLMLVVTSGGTAEAETRTLKLYHVHLREKTEITYKRNGRFLPDGLKKANWALRDWRESKPTDMDPHLLDFLWEIQRRSGTRDYINIIGGYRSPKTNRTLRSRSSGVADNSQHTRGKAIDFFIPDVPLSRVRSIALQLQLGGVGYYPRSGSPFVHIDMGNGRYWPRMNRNELAKIFPQGNTIYLPADGKPLPGYQTALASYNQRRSGASVQMADARSGGPTLLARLFGGGADEAEDEAEAATAPVPRPAAPARRAPAPAPAVQVAAAQPSRPTAPAQLPAGVPMPERNAFDTSARSGARAPVPGAEIPREREVAALDLARVPVPASAPARSAPAVVAAAAEEAPVAGTVSQTLVAALETPAPSAASAGQLAYVPTPSTRPPFEAILQALPVPQAAPAVAAADSEDQPVAMASLEASAPLPVAAPPVPAAQPASEEPSLADGTPVPSALVAALEEAADIAPTDLAAAPMDEPAPSLSGKGGRVLRSEAARAQPAAPRVMDVDEMIGRRIEVASLVTGLEDRALESRPARPRGNMLVVDVPVAGVASGFAPATSVSASDRFSGSAVNFLPMQRLN